jgi:hypothetical protein
LFGVVLELVQQGVVSNCRADVRDILTDLAYVLQHAATATDISVSTTNDATSTTAESTTASSSAVDSMDVNAMQGSTVSSASQVVDNNSKDDTCHNDIQHDAGDECSAEHTAVAVIGGSADMVLDDVGEHAVISDSSTVHRCQQQQHRQHSSSDDTSDNNNNNNNNSSTTSGNSTLIHF